MEGLLPIGGREALDEFCEAVIDEEVPERLRINTKPWNRRAQSCTVDRRTLYPPTSHSG
jgi:hypothetical protein